MRYDFKLTETLKDVKKKIYDDPIFPSNLKGKIELRASPMTEPLSSSLIISYLMTNDLLIETDRDDDSRSLIYATVKKRESSTCTVC